MTVDWAALCTGCLHAPHEPGECVREIQARGGKQPAWQDYPCIHQRRPQ